MSLVVLVLVAAVAIGWLTGGSLDRLGTVPLRRRRLVVGALAVQAAGTLVGGPFYPAGLALSAGLVVWWLALNRGVRGTGLLVLGLLANALVVGANGAMPVSESASARAGISTGALLLGIDPRHELSGAGTRLAWLGDVIAVAAPVRPEVVSPGDVLVAAGLAQLVVVGMVAGGRGVAGAQRVPARPGTLPAPGGAPAPAPSPLPTRASAAATAGVPAPVPAPVPGGGPAPGGTPAPLPARAPAPVPGRFRRFLARTGRQGPPRRVPAPLPTRPVPPTTNEAAATTRPTPGWTPAPRR